MTDADFFEPKDAGFPSAGDEPEDLAKIAEQWYQSARAKRIEIELPVEVRQRFETCRRQVEQLKTELRERLAQVHEWDPPYVLELYTTFAKTVASLIARANAAETFPDSVFARRADEHIKFLAVRLPLWVKGETLNAAEAFGPAELCRFLSRPNNFRKFRVRLDSAICSALRAISEPLQAVGRGSIVQSLDTAEPQVHNLPDQRAEVDAFLLQCNQEPNLKVKLIKKAPVPKV